MVDDVQHLLQLTNHHTELKLSPLTEMLELRELVPWLVHVAGSCLSQAVQCRQELDSAECQANNYRQSTDSRIASLESKIEQDKGLLNTLKESYRVKLDILEREKATIVGQTHSFAQGLDQLQSQLTQKENAILQLRNDLDKSY